MFYPSVEASQYIAETKRNEFMEQQALLSLVPDSQNHQFNVVKRLVSNLGSVLVQAGNRLQAVEVHTSQKPRGVHAV